MAEGYTSINVILDKIMKHPLLRDLQYENVVDYTIDFMKIVGAPEIFMDKVTQLNLSNYRALLPCDYYSMNQVRYICGDGTKSFRYSSDEFHLSDKKNVSKSSDLTYKIQNDIIYTSVETGVIEISYMAIAVDKNGIPLIPDNSKFTRALELYVKLQWFTILFDLGKISPAVLSNTQQQYSWAVGACQNDFHKLTLDKAETFYNSYRTLLIRDNSHSTGFKYDGRKEVLKNR